MTGCDAVRLARIDRDGASVDVVLRYADRRPYVAIRVSQADSGRESAVTLRVGELADVAAAFGLAVRIVIGRRPDDG